MISLMKLLKGGRSYWTFAVIGREWNGMVGGRKRKEKEKEKNSK